MSNLYRGPSIDASSQILVHLAKRFQRRRFLNICLSESRIAFGDHGLDEKIFLEINQSETRIACGGHV
jgi:hypothetical protein